MMKYIPIYTLFLMLVCCTYCKGQNKSDLTKDTPKSEIKDVISSHGPNTSVRTIKQDRKGNIWLASNEGVIRYDGKSFTNITANVSLYRFFSVLEDRKGNFWFGTYGSGVYYYDVRLNDEVGQGKTFQNFTTSDGLANNSVMPIYEDKAGIIWLGTGGGVSRYDGKSFRNFTTKEGLSNNNLTTIMEDKTGKLWFSTRGEPCFYDGKTFTTLTNKDGKGFRNVWSII